MSTTEAIGSSPHFTPQGNAQGSLGSHDGVIAIRGALAAQRDELRVSTYRSWSSLMRLLPEWDAILGKNESLSIFSTYEWQKSWWEAFGANRHLTILAFSDASGNVVGIVPMYMESVSNPVFGRFRELRLVGDGTGDSDNLDLIIQPGYEKTCVAALLKWIAEQRNCGVCHFHTISEKSPTGRMLLDALKRAGWTIRETQTANSSITFPDTWDEYLNRLSSQFRRLIQRCQRKLSSRFDVQFQRCEKAEQLEPMLENLFALHQKRWRSVNEPGSFASAERRAFYRRMAKAFLDRGWLEFWSVALNGKAVATQFAFRYRDTVYGLQEGFDTEYSSDHVGYVLRAAAFESFIQRGVKRYDFLGGVSFYKEQWRAEPGAYVNLSCAGPWSRAGCLLTLEKSAASSKKWLRSHLSSEAWSLLHRANMLLSRRDSHAPALSRPQVATESRSAGVSVE